MTIESADVNALDDVFSSDRDRSGAEPAPEADTGIARDDRGRFAGKSQDAPPAPVTAPPEPVATQGTEPAPVDPNTGRSVPLSELLTERKQRQELAKLHTEAEARAKVYEQQIQQLLQRQTPQPQPQQVQVPAFHEDPEAHLQHQLGGIANSSRNEALNIYEDMARDKHGDEAVDAALNAAKAAGAHIQIAAQRNPWSALMKWHKQEQVRTTVGDDLEAFKKKIADEAVAQALAGLKAGGAQPGAAAPKFPGSLASATGQGSQGAHLTPEAAMGSVFSSSRDRRQG